jgi:glycosyltransferase involved in cell wall biosynthesis
MKENPLVSILMTAYKREQFIGEAIDSVLAIDYCNFELIIVDDGSNDTTVPIIQSFLPRDKRIRFFQNDQNLGDYPNRNKAAFYALGKYLVYVDSDDRIFANALSKFVDAMETHQSSFGIFSHTGNSEIFMLEPRGIITAHFFNKPILNFGPVATIVTKDFFNQVGGFPVKYGPANDMYYNLKGASETSTLVFPFPLVDYRIHEGQEFNNKYSYLYNNYRYLKDALDELNLPLKDDEKIYLRHKNKRRFVVNISKYLFKTGNIVKAILAIKSSGFQLKDLPDALISRSLPKNNC